MPSKNKPKRLDRQRNFRVARRKRRIQSLADGKGRSRASRPKQKISTSLLKGIETKTATKKEVKKVKQKVEKKSEEIKEKKL